ncbi:UTP--glucose-1-phosphate uridylyltransferase GalU [Aquibacillus albus]|uniref:UTP--glucose-1-phosphate uridylyltransferase n=1 Tax=Aquibacillus albus TaxID=1168171 RepID=A0ABS2N6D8_9BACI|nr:UTP--glucose-1-phosphate uridylyltransferase GalU [Aquibacillus albus]MBM7573711.1 UTP--glucose-1-phosphate uridylyltransferase [Aquibacillus albus]
MAIKKAIIPAAGLGTRFLPATKAMPKEMLPVVDKPTIQYIVEEAIKSGIEDIIIVTGKGKRAIEDHFDHAFELEDNLLKKGKFELLDQVKESSTVDIHYIRQKEPKGLGHAIWCARKFIGEEPFAVLLGDDIVQSQTPCLKQLIDQHEKTNATVIGVKKVPLSETNRYGIIQSEDNKGSLHRIGSLVEKPSIEKAPSDLAIMGRYILTPEILSLLENQETGAGGEIQLTDAIATLGKFEPIYGYEFEGKRYDVGDKLGFIQTTIEMALEREDMHDEVLEMLKGIADRYLLNN